jgi:hypothetical protein
MQSPSLSLVWSNQLTTRQIFHTHPLSHKPQPQIPNPPPNQRQCVNQTPTTPSLLVGMSKGRGTVWLYYYLRRFHPSTKPSHFRGRGGRTVYEARLGQARAWENFALPLP